jgi:hypothetical protein
MNAYSYLILQIGGMSKVSEIGCHFMKLGIYELSRVGGPYNNKSFDLLKAQVKANSHKRHNLGKETSLVPSFFLFLVYYFHAVFSFRP